MPLNTDAIYPNGGSCHLGISSVDGWICWHPKVLLKIEVPWEITRKLTSNSLDDAEVRPYLRNTSNPLRSLVRVSDYRQEGTALTLTLGDGWLFLRRQSVP